MNAIHNLMEFRNDRETPVLVLADMHSGILSGEDMEIAEFAGVIENCHAVLDYARTANIPIAMLRLTAPTRSLLETRSYPAWIKGFEPRRSDMVFDRAMPSGYSSPEFARMIERTSRNFVLAGLSGEMSCLSTVIAAFHNHHQATYLSDASCCSSQGIFSPVELAKGVAAVMSLYGAVSNSKVWINASSRSLAGAA